MSEPVQAEPAKAGGGAMALEELIALNDEIAALVRAGVPLERGLLDVGGELRGRLRAIATGLGGRVGGGEDGARREPAAGAGSGGGADPEGLPCGGPGGPQDRTAGRGAGGAG